MSELSETQSASGISRLGRERRGPNRVRRGDVQTAILALLAESDMHGYQMITELAERSRGGWRPGPGSIYPTLRSLQEQGMIRSHTEGSRRVFTITDYGLRSVRESGGAAPWQAFVENDDSRVRLRRAAQTLLNALTQVESSGTDAQADQAAEIAVTARKAIYGILAEDA